MCISPVALRDDKFKRKVARFVPCGKCHQCLSLRKEEWVWRMWHEERDSDSCHFLTLTYADMDDCTVVDNSSGEVHEGVLIYKDLKKFLKRLKDRQVYIHAKSEGITQSEARSKFKPIRYYAVGEYGSKSGRPHFHAIVYNMSPKLKEEICILEQPKNPLEKPSKLDPKSLWPHGYASISQFNVKRLAYTAKYVMKGTEAEHYSHFPRQFHPRAYMSKNPVIGNVYLKNRDWHREHKKVTTLSPLTQREMLLPRFFMERFFTPIERMEYLLPKQLKMLEEQKRRYKSYPEDKYHKIRMDAINHQIKKINNLIKTEKI